MNETMILKKAIMKIGAFIWEVSEGMKIGLGRFGPFVFGMMMGQFGKRVK